ncbi:hypothetical protein [Bacillus sp. AFS041924]|uniref:hypothetical protein n=1 Tax=Bacillus sp. AFS041924 TaxID=2033503 RepID=UPI000BFBF860|nr:hypothetical protein [Bacillus sp. AFS041924]PGS54232.1 hypothetical protein COC46_05865 [Bacillus sp. AFS041924]
MPTKNGQAISVLRRPAGIKRGKSKSISSIKNSLRPNTQVPVVEGFSNVLTANDKAEKLTYTR